MKRLEDFESSLLSDLNVGSLDSLLKVDAFDMDEKQV